MTMETVGVWLTKSTLWMVLVLGLACFLPLFGNVEDVAESSTLRSSIPSDSFRNSSYVMIPLSFIYILDFVIDCLSSDGVKQHKSKAYLLNGLEILVFEVGILIVPVISYLPASTPALALIYICASRCQTILMTGFIMHTCHRHYPTFFPAVITQFVVVGVGFVSIAQVYAVAEVRNVTPFRWGLFYTEAALGGLVIICFIRWIYSIFLITFLFPRITKYLHANHSRNGAANDVATQRMAHKERSIYFPLSYVLSAIIYLIFNLIVSSETDMLEYTANDLLLLNLPLLFFQLSMTLLASQLAKFEAMDYLYELLESKKSYVRYISHELRTPLNTSCLGLDMLLQEMGKLPNGMSPEEQDRFEVISDINIACITAVDILNDLLCFEKLDSGPLELHKEDMPALKFIKECVGMFSVHARSKEIKIVLEYAGTGVDCGEMAKPGDDIVATEGESYPLHDTEMVSMDKFKMSQVIRNLVSNALKFSPRGGIVTVRVHFVPDERTALVEGENDNNNRRFGLRSSLVSWMKKMATLYRGLSNMITATRSRGGRVFATHNDSHSHEKDLSNLPRRASSSTSPKINMNRRRSSSAYVARRVYANADTNGDGFIKGRLVVKVLDSGAGISEENQRRLFHEVVQFNPEKLQAGGGSGLGLMITKGIVDKHQGTISVYSKGEGLGSCFTMALPMQWNGATSVFNALMEGRKTRKLPLSGKSVKSGVSVKSGKSVQWDLEPAAVGGGGAGGGNSFVAEVNATGLGLGLGSTLATVGEEGVASTMTTPPKGTYHLLVVDDSQMNRKMLLRVMKGQGYTCEEAEDGQQAVDVIKNILSGGKPRGYFDCILMDFMMPVLDGPSATKQIRELGYTGKIFAVTGNVLQHDIDHFIACGANLVFTKPLNIDAFKEEMLHNDEEEDEEEEEEEEEGEGGH